MATQTKDKTAETPSAGRPERADASAERKVATPANHIWQSLALRPGAIQTKMAVSQPGDPQEQQADHIADRVMRMPIVPRNSNELSLSADATAEAHKSEGGEEEENKKLQPEQQSAGSDSAEVAPPIIHEALNSSAQRLDPSTRSFMEPRFSSDFSQVRVHADERAAESASAINARAFTVDRDIVFGAGEYAPQTESGRRLLSHELTHVVQQQSAVHLGIQRQPAATATPTAVPAPAAALPSAEELTTRIARCIGIWETNRGKDTPAPKESSLDTVAGIHASMATIEQATMPYAITALKGHKELRDKATPALTMKELNDAEARCTAVVTLLTSVSSASASAQAPDDFINDNAAAITASGLSNADVKTMFSAVTLKATLAKVPADIQAAGDAAKQEAVTAKKSKKEQAALVKAAKEKAMTDALAAISTTDRLGLGESSLKAYINKPRNWGENTAGWQRKAVNAMANNVGARIQAVAVSDSGAGLAIPVIRARVDVELAKTPVPGKDDIVKTVAQQNNPNETDYGKNVLATYDRLYP